MICIKMTIHKQTNKKLESLVIKNAYVSHRFVKSTISIALVSLVLLCTGLVFMSCSLEQGSAHMIPIFSSTSPFERSIRSSAPDYTFAIPPIEGWETADLPAGTSTIDIEIFGTTVPCTLEFADDHVAFAGANDSVDLDFTVFDDDRFSYTGTILLEKTDGSLVMVESSIEEVEISGDFISGTGGIARAWVVDPDTDPETGTSWLMNLTYSVGIEDGILSFTTATIDHTDPDSSLYVAPSDIGLENWAEKRKLFDEEFPSSSETPEEVIYTFNNGVWE